MSNNQEWRDSLTDFGFDKYPTVDKPKKPGAPIGNTNAKKDTTRVRLNALVKPDTLTWLKSNGNVGRYLDELRKKMEIE